MTCLPVSFTLVFVTLLKSYSNLTSMPKLYTSCLEDSNISSVLRTSRQPLLLKHLGGFKNQGPQYGPQTGLLL